MSAEALSAFSWDRSGASVYTLQTSFVVQGATSSGMGGYIPSKMSSKLVLQFQVSKTVSRSRHEALKHTSNRRRSRCRLGQVSTEAPAALFRVEEDV